eukprot:6176762-Pleurochrysis_carterae.AAC.1
MAPCATHMRVRANAGERKGHDSGESERNNESAGEEKCERAFWGETVAERAQKEDSFMFSGEHVQTFHCAVLVVWTHFFDPVRKFSLCVGCFFFCASLNEGVPVRVSRVRHRNICVAPIRAFFFA